VGSYMPAYLAIIARKNCLNPGTRFYARGLNHFAGAGNEMECEQLLVVDVCRCGATRKRHNKQR